ncbi:MAG: hypothetical protein AB7N76_30385 [Planctomycetota bacterium]
MSDDARRERERGAAGGDAQARGAALRARLRAGELAADALEVAALLGHEAALAALDREHAAAAAHPRELAAPLARCGRRACARAVLACAEAVGALGPLNGFEQTTTDRVVGAIEEWLEEPSARRRLVLADQDHDFLAWVSNGYWLNSLVIVAIEPEFPQQTEHVLRTAAGNVGPERVRAALAAALPEALLGGEPPRG